MTRQGNLMIGLGGIAIVYGLLQLVQNLIRWMSNLYWEINTSIENLAVQLSVPPEFFYGLAILMCGFLMLVFIVAAILIYRRKRRHIEFSLWKRRLTVAQSQLENLQKTETATIEREKTKHALKISNIDHLKGVDFEQYVGELFKFKGYTVTITKASNDLGVDVIAEKAGKKTAIQVKRQSKAVSRRAVSDVVAGKQHYQCDFAMVVTNDYFQKGAKELATSTQCQLIDRDELAVWMTDYHAVEVEELLEVREIREKLETQKKKIRFIERKIALFRDK